MASTNKIKKTTVKSSEVKPRTVSGKATAKVAAKKIIKADTKAKAVAKKTPRKKVSGYFEAVGRRKTSVARVRITADKSNKIIVNNKDYKEYFPTEELQVTANAPLRKTKLTEEFGVTVLVKGGGATGQAEAMRHGVARALIKYDEGLRLRVKKSGYLKRDPREKERKKYGLKRARKASQWSKR